MSDDLKIPTYFLYSAVCDKPPRHPRYKIEEHIYNVVVDLDKMTPIYAHSSRTWEDQKELAGFILNLDNAQQNVCKFIGAHAKSYWGRMVHWAVDKESRWNWFPIDLVEEFHRPAILSLEERNNFSYNDMMFLLEEDPEFKGLEWHRAARCVKALGY